MACIKVNLKVLKEGITELEGRLTLVDALNVVQKVKDSLSLKSFKDKFKSVIQKNPGFDKLAKYGMILSGEKVEGVTEVLVLLLISRMHRWSQWIAKGLLANLMICFQTKE